MLCAINKLKSHMIFTCKNFKWKKKFTPENDGGGGGGGGSANPLSFPTLSLRS